MEVDAFARALLAGQPAFPRYFARMRPINQAGPRLLGGIVPEIRSLTVQQSPVDAALVFRRWVNSNRRQVKWVAMPSLDRSEDVLERVRYVLQKDAPGNVAFA